MKRAKFINAVAVALLGYFPAGTLKAGEAEIARFETEYPKAAKQLEKRYFSIKGTCRLLREQRNKPDKIDERHAVFVADHGFQKVSITPKENSRNDNRMNEIVYCVGEKSAFSVVRKSDSEPYIVQGIGADHRDRNQYISQFGRFLNAPYAILGIPLSEIMTSPTYQLNSAEEVSDEGAKLIRIEYEVGDNSQRDKVWLILDPGSGWMIRSGEIRPGKVPGARMKFDIEYKPSQDGLPVPRRVRFIDPSLLASTCEFESFSFGSTPKNEFSMEYYGLTDLASPRSPSSSNNMVGWLLGASLLGVLVAYSLRRVANRPMKKST